MNIRTIFLLVICVTYSAQVMGQIEQVPTLTVEYGNLSELRAGQNRVFVHTENLDSRGKILKELAKYSRLEIVGRIEDADFLLVYGSSLVRTSFNSLDDNFAAPGGFPAVNGDMVALKLIGDSKGVSSRGSRTRILWYTRGRQTFIRTDQFFSASQVSASSSKSTLISALVGGLLSRIPKLSFLPMGRSPEVRVTRTFIKDLKDVHERQIKLSATRLRPSPLVDTLRTAPGQGNKRNTRRQHPSSVRPAKHYSVASRRVYASGARAIRHVAPSHASARKRNLTGRNGGRVARSPKRHARIFKLRISRRSHR